jgi:taurine transport system permease protein
VPRELRRYPLVRARVASGLAWFVLPFLVLLAIWYMAVEVTDVPERVFPQVTSVWGAFVALLADGTLWEHVSASLRRVFVGALIGIVTAVPFGLAMGVNRYVSTFFTRSSASPSRWRVSPGSRWPRSGSATAKAQ